MVSHCSTAAHAARLLAVQCGVANPENNLAALSLKEQGNKAFEHGDLQQAENLYSQAVEIKPSGGLHFIFANRSAARLARGDAAGALEDARQAVAIVSKWGGALVREAEAHAALGNIRDALCAYRAAAQVDSSIRRSRRFQNKVRDWSPSLWRIWRFGDLAIWRFGEFFLWFADCLEMQPSSQIECTPSLELIGNLSPLILVHLRTIETNTYRMITRSERSPHMETHSRHTRLRKFGLPSCRHS